MRTFEAGHDEGSRTYLVENVLQGVGAVDREADKQEVRLRVGERSKSVILLLTGSVPECKFHHLAGRRVWSVCNVIFKNGRYVFLHDTLSQSVALKRITDGPRNSPLGSSLGCS